MTDSWSLPAVAAGRVLWRAAAVSCGARTLLPDRIAAIYHSLRRRRGRLEDQAVELRRLAASGQPVPVVDLPGGVRIADLDDFDFDDYGDAEREILRTS